MTKSVMDDVDQEEEQLTELSSHQPEITRDEEKTGMQ